MAPFDLMAHLTPYQMGHITHQWRCREASFELADQVSEVLVLAGMDRSAF